jgi:hypothetical protein
MQGMFHDTGKSSSQLGRKKLLLYCHQYPHVFFFINQLIQDRFCKLPASVSSNRLGRFSILDPLEDGSLTFSH